MNFEIAPRADIYATNKRSPTEEYNIRKRIPGNAA
jgi:hypothetical protein